MGSLCVLCPSEPIGREALLPGPGGPGKDGSVGPSAPPRYHLYCLQIVKLEV